MRVPNSAHTSQPWRIHELTHDFQLEDVWELPIPGAPDDFPRAVKLAASLDPSRGSSCAAGCPADGVWPWKPGTVMAGCLIQMWTTSPDAVSA